MAGISGYFDYAAATPVDPSVLKAMGPFFSDQFYNPSANYGPSRDVKKALDKARSEIAQILGVKPAEIIFTAGGTEANNLAIQGVMQKFPGSNMIFSAIEHDSIFQPASNFEHQICPVKPNGIVDINEVSRLINDNTVLVSVMIANNEVGTIQPIRKISQAVEVIRLSRRKSGNSLPLYFHTDASQGANYLDLHANRLGIDMMSLNAGKIYGPKQTGLLYIKGGIELKPIIFGGGQEKNVRSGTENVPGIIGLAEALKLASQVQSEESARLKKLQSHFITQLSEKLPHAGINATLKSRLPNNIHITIPGQDNERLMILLDQKGFYCAVGSACSASHEESSHVLKAIGLTTEQIHSSLRFTMGRHTKEPDVTDLVDALVSVLA